MSETQVQVIDEHEDYEKGRKNRIITSSCTTFCHFAIMIAAVVVLVSDSSSCHYPIRAWLVVYVVLSIVGTLTSLLIEIVTHKKHLKRSIVQKLYAIYYFVLILFFIAWTILGSVWVYVDDNCKHEFETGWKLTVAILAINYGIFIMCSCAGCVAVLYVVSWNYIRSVKNGEEIVKDDE